MKSPLTKLAAAAIVIIACVIGWWLWRGTESGIALADVLAKIERITGYMYQMNSTTSTRGNSTTSMSTVLVSREHGIKTITKTTDPNNHRIACQEKYWLWGRKPVTIIIIDHDKKTHLSMKMGSGMSEKRVVQEFDEPRTIIKQLLSCKHNSLGQSEVDGVTVEGFQTTDPVYDYEKGFGGQTRLFAARPEKVDVKLWVDVNTFLPVRVEEEIVTTAGSRNHNISYNFRWNVVVNASDFEPNIPSDYTNPGGDISIPKVNEETAIRGLGLFAERAKNYPATPSYSMKSEFQKQVKEIMGYDSWKELTEDERTRRNNEILGPLSGFRQFYGYLVRNKKDPAYYGETVTPEDKDKVLIRWKLSENEYRVIFGDLHAETVSPEKLAELEKVVSK